MNLFTSLSPASKLKKSKSSKSVINSEETVKLYYDRLHSKSTLKKGSGRRDSFEMNNTISNDSNNISTFSSTNYNIHTKDTDNNTISSTNNISTMDSTKDTDNSTKPTRYNMMEDGLDEPIWTDSSGGNNNEECGKKSNMKRGGPEDALGNVEVGNNEQGSDVVFRAGRFLKEELQQMAPQTLTSGCTFDRVLDELGASELKSSSESRSSSELHSASELSSTLNSGNVSNVGSALKADSIFKLNSSFGQKLVQNDEPAELSDTGNNAVKVNNAANDASNNTAEVNNTANNASNNSSNVNTTGANNESNNTAKVKDPAINSGNNHTAKGKDPASNSGNNNTKVKGPINNSGNNNTAKVKEPVNNGAMLSSIFKNAVKLEEPAEVKNNGEITKGLAEKYGKMLKVGLAREVVRHKIVQDGYDAEKVFEVLEGGNKVDPNILKKYKTMLKLGLPVSVIEHKLKMEGMDPTSILRYMQIEQKNQLPPRANMVDDGKIRKKLYWNTINKDASSVMKNEEDTGKFWNTANDLFSPNSQKLLETFFVQEKDNGSPKNADPVGIKRGLFTKKREIVCLLDPKRGQNIAITLARIKIPFSEIKQGIFEMNENILTSMQVKSIIELWPTDHEVKRVVNYNPKDSRAGATLGKAECFVLEMSKIPRFKSRMECLFYKQEFGEHCKDIRSQMESIQLAIDQIFNSTIFKNTMHYVLQAGNFLNVGSVTVSHEPNCAFGFSVSSSLNKLAQTKSFDRTINLLDLIVHTMESDLPSEYDTDLSKELCNLPKCRNLSIPSIELELLALKKGLDQIVLEFPFKEEEKMNPIQAFIGHVRESLEQVGIDLLQLKIKLDEFLHYFGEDPQDVSLKDMFESILQFVHEVNIIKKRGKSRQSVKKFQDAMKQGSVLK